MLELSGIGKTFGGIDAIRNVSLRLCDSEVRGLIGPNGAGKSTLVNVISGLLTHSSGNIWLDTVPLDALSAHRRAALGIARTFQNLRVFSSLSVQQNIDVAHYTGARRATQRTGLLTQAIERFDLADKLFDRADSLTYGYMRRLEIVRALALQPRVLLLDEPAAGMNEQETAGLAEALKWVHSQSDCTMLVIDHDLKFIMTLCNQITVLNMGGVIAQGNPREVAENRQVIDAYLGEDHDTAA